MSFARFSSIVVCGIFNLKVLYVRKPIFLVKNICCLPFSKYYVFRFNFTWHLQSKEAILTKSSHHVKVLTHLLQNVNFYFRRIRLSWITLGKKCPNKKFFLVCIKSECGKIRTRKNSVSGHFSHSFINL